MDLTKVLHQLHEELDILNAAILSLERLQDSGRRRGRPPAILAELRAAARGGTAKRKEAKTEDSARKAPAPRQPITTTS
jgi:hypothetical protein